MNENYIQYSTGYSRDNITLADIDKAIVDIQKTDDEHGAFWVAVIADNENVIETDKYLNLVIVFEDDEANYRAKDWNEVKELYQLLLEDKLDIIRERIK